jgi:hypothetical protein
VEEFAHQRSRGIEVLPKPIEITENRQNAEVAQW